MKQTLGTQLRHLLDLLDGAVARKYASMGVDYRPRYTPVLRALIAGELCTVGEIAAAAGITQPAATQTVALMVKDQLIEAASSSDARQKLLRLTDHGRSLLPHLQEAWEATAQAAAGLDDELPAPLSEVLDAAIQALARKSFDERIREAGSGAVSTTGKMMPA
ncbi:MAG: MarR family transcriptional regulator [Pseudomonadota bacterium]|nr:MarR family transcriptional regulator [Pseudomonadota bacterium]